MFKIILKNLWSRRNYNVWLFLELILITVIAWVVVNPVVQLLHNRSLPLGYDADRLCLIKLDSDWSEDVRDTLITREEAVRIIADRLQGMEEVENVLLEYYSTSLGTEFVWRGKYSSKFRPDSPVETFQLIFQKGKKYFETFGIKSLPGSPSPEQLSEGINVPNGVVVTRSFAIALFGTDRVVGDSISLCGQNEDRYSRIVGVVEDVRVRSYSDVATVVFSTDMYPMDQLPRIVVRLREGVSPSLFSEKIAAQSNRELCSGRQFIRSILPFEDLARQTEYSFGITNEVRLDIALAVFFMVSLCLGVVGSFWFQTRRRKEEIFIMRSFGATRRTIVSMLLGEGVVMVTMAVFVGCMAYLQYVHQVGTQSIRELWEEGFFVDSCFSNFTFHFTVVSFIVYVLLLAVVCLGIYIPARRT